MTTPPTPVLKKNRLKSKPVGTAGGRAHTSEVMRVRLEVVGQVSVIEPGIPAVTGTAPVPCGDATVRWLGGYGR
jgi:hypothetical protein